MDKQPLIFIHLSNNPLVCGLISPTLSMSIVGMQVLERADCITCKSTAVLVFLYKYLSCQSLFTAELVIQESSYSLSKISVIWV